MANISWERPRRVMPYSFELASSIASDLESGEYDAVHLLYNEFKSAIAYTPSEDD